MQRAGRKSLTCAENKLTPGRNEPCTCGSGRKYKLCCGSFARRAQATANVDELVAAAVARLQSGFVARAERELHSALALEPAHPGATHFLGVAQCRLGRWEEGLPELQRSLALAPANVDFQQNTGLLLAQGGKLEEAEQLFRRLVESRPELPSAHDYLGMVRQRRGMLQDAISCYRRALELAPQNDGTHTNLGLALFELGEVDAAIEQYRRAILINPGNAMAHNNLGNALRTGAKPEEVLAAYRRAAELDPRSPMPHYNAGTLLLARADVQGALASFRAAVRAAPGERACLQGLADSLSRLRFDLPEAEVESEIADCLSHPGIDGSRLAPAALSLLRADRALDEIVRSAPNPAQQGIATAVVASIAGLSRPLALALLENAIVPDAQFERFLTWFRAALLAAWRVGALEPDAQNEALVCALAQQCFLTEYLYSESDAEQTGLAGLQEAVNSSSGKSGAAARVAIALLGCYRPLWRFAPLHSLRPPPQSTLARLVKRQIAEPLEEKRIAEAMSVLTPVHNAVSMRVQAQYQENPYPRWLHAPSLAGAYPLSLKLRTLFPLLDPALTTSGERPAILIAGCGTGQHAAVTASMHPDSRITAMDISRASLAYAQRRLREMGIRNVSLRLADILELGGLADRFELIECAGVLHHLEDPLAGWRMLNRLLKPGGFMKIALYSELARAPVKAARELIAERGFGADAAGIRAARQAILALSSGVPARGVAAAPDFYSLSGCRDLIFHAQEHRFTPEKIAAAIDALGLQFLGFEFDEPSALEAYREAYPADPSAVSFDNWSDFEAAHPDTFAAMYQFWVRKPA